MYTALLNQWKKHIALHNEKDNGYAITNQCWEEIQSHIQPPSGLLRTLETGSGLSTWLFSTQHTIHTALEHSPHWFRITVSSPFVQKSHVLLLSLEGDPPWYVYERVNIPKFNLILIDGPTGDIGREGILSRIESLLSPGGVVIVDDIQREAEAHLGVSIANLFNTSIKYKVANTRQTFGIIKTT